MLTPLQRDIASIVGGLPEAKQFALAGGAALIARGDVDRLTRDLDFFGPSTTEVDQLIPIVERHSEMPDYPFIEFERVRASSARGESSGRRDRSRFRR